jgi:hypothetical protein
MLLGKPIRTRGNCSRKKKGNEKYLAALSRALKMELLKFENRTRILRLLELFLYYTNFEIQLKDTVAPTFFNLCFFIINLPHPSS